MSKMFPFVSHVEVPGMVPFTDQREREREFQTASKASYFWNWLSSVMRSEEWCHVSVLMLHVLISIQNRRIIH